MTKEIDDEEKYQEDSAEGRHQHQDEKPIGNKHAEPFVPDKDIDTDEHDSTLSAEAARAATSASTTDELGIQRRRLNILQLAMSVTDSIPDSALDQHSDAGSSTTDTGSATTPSWLDPSFDLTLPSSTSSTSSSASTPNSSCVSLTPADTDDVDDEASEGVLISDDAGQKHADEPEHEQGHDQVLPAGCNRHVTDDGASARADCFQANSTKKEQSADEEDVEDNDKSSLKSNNGEQTPSSADTPAVEPIVADTPASPYIAALNRPHAVADEQTTPSKSETEQRPSDSPTEVVNDAWQSYVDPEGRTYWHNSITKESTWEAPDHRKDTSSSHSSSSTSFSRSLSLSSSSSSPTSDTDSFSPSTSSPSSSTLYSDEEIECAWRCYFDKTASKQYWYNSLTKTSVWEDPRKDRTKLAVGDASIIMTRFRRSCSASSWTRSQRKELESIIETDEEDDAEEDEEDEDQDGEQADEEDNAAMDDDNDEGSIVGANMSGKGESDGVRHSSNPLVCGKLDLSSIEEECISLALTSSPMSDDQLSPFITPLDSDPIFSSSS